MKASAILRAQDLARWHTVNVAHRQTLADHQWAVTSLTMLLYRELHKSDTIPAELIVKAMFHDMGEIESGDVPAPAKDYTIGEHKVSPDDLLISIADALEAYHWIWNNAQGQYSKVVVVQDCHLRLVRRCNAAQATYGSGIFDAVDKIIADLGLPERVF